MKRDMIVVFMLVSTLLSAAAVVNAQLAPTNKYVAFRDDDVAPFSRHIDALKAVNQVHIDEGVPVTLGIIPHPVPSAMGNELLQDYQFLSYMRSIASDPLFEFAQHGYTHVNDRLWSVQSEFAGRPFDTQLELIQKGQADIKEAFGVTPTTFIPPFDVGDNDTLQAVAALGFTTYSAGFSDYHMQGRYQDGVKIEGSFSIGAGNDTAFSESILSAINVTERFLNDPNSGDTLTVAYHAWAFDSGNGHVDARKIELLKVYIDYLKVRGVLFTRLDRSASIENTPAGSESEPLGVLNVEKPYQLWLGAGAGAIFLLAFAWFVVRGNNAYK